MNHDLYIFNPENDLALAFGHEGYTAPPLAQQLRHDLQMLPLWYCSDKASILSLDTDFDTIWIQSLHQSFGIKASAVKPNRLQCSKYNYIPWGWNLDLRSRLLGDCVPASQLPSAQYINQIRRLSHRATSIAIHTKLSEMLSMSFSPIPVEVHSVNEIQQYERSHPQCFIKAPWSSSGKGIYRVLEPDARCFTTWAQGIINRQGSIMCEHSLNKVLDFAMEFSCSNGKAEFCGYSVFRNDSHCSFDSAIVMDTTGLESYINNIFHDRDTLSHVREALVVILSDYVASHYNGFLGIDMMLYLDDNNVIQLNPCVEMNLRTTMGVVTSIIGNRFIHPSSQGVFKVEYHKPGISISDHIDNLSSSRPLIVENRKIKSGLQVLTPIYPDSRYCAYIDVTSR